MGLAHAFVTAPPAEDGEARSPDRWMLFLPGLLGTGANWRTFAKQIVAADPSWGAVLVDLRLHGESREGFLPPHTIAAAAGDVVELIAEIEAREQGRPVRGILAHSFGGKVALEVARKRASDFDHAFIVDSSPSARPDRRGSESTQHIVDLLMTLPTEFPNRPAFTAWMEEQGVSRPTAMWLAMNVRALPNSTKFVFSIDVAAIRALLADFFLVDLWDVLEKPQGPMQTHLIVGGRSAIVSPADRERAARCPRVTVDVIDEADHWVHVDAPVPLRALVLEHLAR